MMETQHWIDELKINHEGSRNNKFIMVSYVFFYLWKPMIYFMVFCVCSIMVSFEEMFEETYLVNIHVTWKYATRFVAVVVFMFFLKLITTYVNYITMKIVRHLLDTSKTSSHSSLKLVSIVVEGDKTAFPSNFSEKKAMRDIPLDQKRLFEERQQRRKDQKVGETRRIKSLDKTNKTALYCASRIKRAAERSVHELHQVHEGGKPKKEVFDTL